MFEKIKQRIWGTSGSKGLVDQETLTSDENNQKDDGPTKGGKQEPKRNPFKDTIEAQAKEMSDEVIKSVLAELTVSCEEIKKSVGLADPGRNDQETIQAARENLAFHAEQLEKILYGPKNIGGEEFQVPFLTDVTHLVEEAIKEVQKTSLQIITFLDPQPVQAEVGKDLFLRALVALLKASAKRANSEMTVELDTVDLLMNGEFCEGIRIRVHSDDLKLMVEEFINALKNKDSPQNSDELIMAERVIRQHKGTFAHSHFDSDLGRGYFEVTLPRWSDPA